MEGETDGPDAKKARLEDNVAVAESGTQPGTAPATESAPPKPSSALVASTFSNAVVVFTSVGRQLAFSKDDLVFPERFRVEHEAQRYFYEKQWNRMKDVWMERAMRDKHLQKLTLEEFIEDMAASLERRWALRKQAAAEHKKKKKQAKREERQRLLELHDANRRTSVFVTNIAPAADFEDPATKEDILEDVLQGLRTHAPDLKGEVIRNPKPWVRGSATLSVPQDIHLLPIPEGSGLAENLWDDQYGILVECGTVGQAAAVVANAHHQLYDGRYLVADYHAPPTSAAQERVSENGDSDSEDE